MESIIPTMINLSYMQLLGLLHPYFLFGIYPFSVCSFIFTIFPWWDVWDPPHVLFLCTPTILSFVPKATTTITPHRTTICSNVTRMVACPASDWAIGTSNTSSINFISPCLRVSLTVGLCLLIFESSCIGLLPRFTGSSCWCVWTYEGLLLGWLLWLAHSWALWPNPLDV